MPAIVVDASAFAALLFNEARASEVVEAIAGHNLKAPRLLRFELISIARKKLEQGAATVATISFALRSYFSWGIIEVDVPLRPVLELAVLNNISGYDASYLWLAQANGLDLLTFDVELARTLGR